MDNFMNANRGKPVDRVSIDVEKPGVYRQTIAGSEKTTIGQHPVDRQSTVKRPVFHTVVAATRCHKQRRPSDLQNQLTFHRQNVCSTKYC